MNLKDIDMSKIRPNPRQPREKFDKNEIKALAENIKKNDLLQPIVVHEDGGNYEIVSGERRWRAFETLGRETIPAIKWPVKGDLERDVKSLSENWFREDLTSEERENMVHQIYEESDMTYEEVAEAIGTTKDSINNALRGYRERQDSDMVPEPKSKVSTRALTQTAIIEDQEDKDKLRELMIEGKVPKGGGGVTQYSQVIRDAGEEGAEQVKEAVLEDPDKFTPKKAEKIMELDNEKAQEEMVMEVEAENLTEDEVTTRVERLKDHKEETGDYPEETKIEEPSKRHVEKVKEWSKPSFLVTGGWEDELSLQDRDKVVNELKETRGLIDHALRNLGEEPKETEVEVIDVEVKDD